MGVRTSTHLLMLHKNQILIHVHGNSQSNHDTCNIYSVTKKNLNSSKEGTKLFKLFPVALGLHKLE